MMFDHKVIKSTCLLVPVALLLLLPYSYSAESKTSTDSIQTQTRFVPSITASSYIIIDVESRQILAQKNAHQSNPPASLTKLMTALVAFENLDLQQEITISNKAATMEPSKMYLYQNEKIKVADLFKGLLIASANDAAVALAEAVSGSERQFTTLMNNKASTLGMQESLFENASGFDQTGHISSPYDIALLSLEFLEEPFFAPIIATSRDSVYSSNQQFRHNLLNTNEALVTPGVIGIKTGSTDQAGQTLSLLVERDGKKVLAVFFGSQNRLQDANAIINWVYDHNTWRQISIPYCSYSWKEIILTTQFNEQECFSYSTNLILPKI